MPDDTTPPDPPAGYALVGRERFFHLLAAERRDVMPTVRDPAATWWEEQHTRAPWGWSWPGWRVSGDPRYPHVYAVLARAGAGEAARA